MKPIRVKDLIEKLLDCNQNAILCNDFGDHILAVEKNGPIVTLVTSEERARLQK